MKISLSRFYGLLGVLIICCLFLVGCGGTNQPNIPGSTSGSGSNGGSSMTGNNSITATATQTQGSTSPNQPNPTDTPTPTPTPTPSPTSAPSYPNVAGSYSGSYTWNGQSGSYPMQMDLSQSGPNISGTTTEGSTVYNDSGTIDTGGNFTITEYSNGSAVAYLYGSTSGNTLSGTWSNTSGSGGTWSVSK